MLRVLQSWGGGLVRSRARRLSRRFLRDASDCRASQTNVLRRLLHLGAGTRFQSDHRITSESSVSEFRRRVPITDYADLSPYVEALKGGNHAALCGARNRPRMFALTSGTTGETKFIPVTTQFLKDYRRGWTVWGINAFDDHPQLLKLKILQIASHYDRFRTTGGVPCGNISGLVQCMQSRFLRFLYTLPAALLEVTDPAAKTYLLLRIALADKHVGLVMTANPGTLLHIAREMDARKETLLRDIHDGTLTLESSLRPSVHRALTPFVARPDPQRARELDRAADRLGRLRPRDAWPHLTLLGVWTGGSAGVFLPAVRDSYGDVAIRDHGLSASEGRMTIPFVDETPSGVLDVTSHFFEFIPEDQLERAEPDTLLAHELERDGRYAILLTTAAGLYRYNICDVVRCTGHWGTTPLLEFLHKGAHIANIAGEKVTESQVVAALKSASHQLALECTSATVAPVYGDPPAYQLMIEAGEFVDPADVRRLASLMDLDLQQLNCEYADKRASGRLAPLAPLILPAGTWAAMIRRRQSQPGGSLEQYKHPFLKPDLDFVNDVLTELKMETSNADRKTAADAA